MQIRRVQLDNWRRHERLDIELEPLTIIVGPNGAGKSSIAQAIRWGLTGRCEWTDARGAGAEWLVRHGARSARVALEIEGVGTVERQVSRGKAPVRLQVGNLQGSTTVQQDMLYRALGCTGDTLDGMLDIGTYVWTAKPREQVERILRISGTAIPAEQVAAHIQEVAGRDVRRHLNDDAYTPDGLEALYNWAYQQRRADRKAQEELERLEAMARQQATAPQESIPQLEEALASSEAEAADAETALSALMDQAARAARWASEVRAVQEALQRAEQEAQAEDPEPIRKALGKQMRELRRRELEAEALQDHVANLRSRVAHLEAVVAHPSCPLAAAGICQTPPEAMAQAIEKARVDLGTAREQERDTASQLAKLRARVHALREEVAKLQAALARAEAAAARAKQAQERVGELRARLEELQAQRVEDVASEALAAARQRFQQAAARAAEIRARIDQAKRAGAAPQQSAVAERLAALKERLADAEAICKALAPDGRNRLLQSVAAGVVEQINNLLPQILPGARLSIASEPEPHLEVAVGGGQPTPLSYLSESEQMRVGIAIQLALAAATGVRCMVIDEADRLDPDNRAALLEMLLAHRDLYDTVLILATRGDVQPVDPGVDGLAVYEMDADGIRRAPAALGVAS